MRCNWPNWSGNFECSTYFDHSLQQMYYPFLMESVLATPSLLKMVISRPNETCSEPHPINASYRNKLYGIKASFVLCVHWQPQSKRRTGGIDRSLDSKICLFKLWCVMLAFWTSVFTIPFLFLCDYELSFRGLLKTAYTYCSSSFSSHVSCSDSRKYFLTYIWWGNIYVCAGLQRF